MKAAVYARVSTPAQGEEDKASIPEQIARIEKYCEEKGYIIADRYVDIGYSGAKSKRPEFQRMLNDAKSNKFDVIVCWKADRLSRGMYPAAALMEVIEPLGISLEAVEEHLDMNYFAMLAVVGKMEIDNIKARTRMGHEGRAKQGKMQGRAPFGYFYNKETEHYEIDEKEAGIVRWIFELYIGGTPVKQIAAKLNLIEISTKDHSKLGWTTSKVNLILSRPLYYGEGYYNRATQASGKRKLKAQDSWISVEYPPIISRETFEAALARKQTNTRLNRGRTNQVYLLRGLLHCEECGMRFYIAPRSGNHKKRLADGTIKTYERKNGVRGYECRGIREYPHLYHCRTPRRIPSDEIELLVWGKLDEALRHPEMLRKALEVHRDNLKAKAAEKQQRIKEVTDKIGSSQREEQWLITQARKGNITEEQMTLQLKAVREEKEFWQGELGKIEQLKEIEAKKEDILAQAQQICSQLVSRLDYLANSTSPEALEEKRIITQLLVDKVTINREGVVTIQLAIPEPISQASVGVLPPASS